MVDIVITLCYIFMPFRLVEVIAKIILVNNVYVITTCIVTNFVTVELMRLKND